MVFGFELLPDSPSATGRENDADAETNGFAGGGGVVRYGRRAESVQAYDDCRRDVNRPNSTVKAARIRWNLYHDELKFHLRKDLKTPLTWRDWLK